MSVFKHNVQAQFGFEPDTLDIICKANAAMSQYQLVEFDFGATTATDNNVGSETSGFYNVKKTPTAAPLQAVIGVCQEACASGAQVRVRVKGITKVLGTSATYVVGTSPVIKASGSTAGTVDLAVASATLQLPVGICLVGGSTTTPTILLDGAVARARFPQLS